MLDIYIGNLPTRASVEDVRELVASLVGEYVLNSCSGGSVFTRLRKKILSQFDIRSKNDAPSFILVEAMSGRFPRYCHISCSSSDETEHIIRELSGAGLLGNSLNVRPYFRRSRKNDRRRFGRRFRPWLGVERRKGERRSAQR